MARTPKKVKLSEFESAVSEALSEYHDYVSEVVMKKAIDATGEDTAKIIAANAPVRYGEYQSSITYGHRNSKGKGKYSVTVYSDGKYTLTHLLEKEHALRNGSRSKPHAHWSVGYDSIPDNLIKHIKEAL